MLEIFPERKGKPRVYKLKDERDFYLLIEQRMREHGYQLLDTLKGIRANDTFDSPCYTHSQ